MLVKYLFLEQETQLIISVTHYENVAFIRRLNILGSVYKSCVENKVSHQFSNMKGAAGRNWMCGFL
jgi:hypothetical protein